VRFTRPQIILLLGAAFLVLLVTNAFVSFRASRSVIEIQHHLRESYQEQLQLQDVLSDLRDAETGQRGYLLTGKDSYLEPYRAAVSKVGHDLDGLRKFISSEQYDQIKQLVNAKLAELQQTISMKQKGDSAGALAVVNSGVGKEHMDETRELLGRLQTDAGEQLQQLTAQRDVAERRRTLTFILSNGLVILIFILLVIVSARQEATLRATVERVTAELRTSNKDLEAFNYSVSHDLRTPLRAIQGFVQALQEDYGPSLDSGVIEYTDRIAAAAHRMSRMIQDLLLYSRLSRAELKIEAVNVKHAIQQALEAVAPASGSIDVQVDNNVAVAASESMLVQILSNLISNALKFTAPATTPKVGITAAPNGNEVAISVRDEGIGIAREHTERIFGVFERLHTEGEYQGTGVGLALVKRGVERLGGSISVASEVGKGSEFIVRLPRAEQSRT
jgi:signal transduction histidine kinase